MTYDEIKKLTDTVRAESEFVDSVLSEISRVIVGQRYLLERLLVGLLADGHILVEGVPGLAKTMAVRCLADCLQVKFQRIQFTPDLLPADVIGTMVYDQSTGTFKAKKGPVFTNLLLADEINRAPAKVQSALLEAMQERQVTIGEQTYRLEDPFLVMATQNPIEHEGTYPLPEAQIDRFMLKLKVTYPSKEEEVQILQRMTKEEMPWVRPVATKEQILKARSLVRKIYLDEKLARYIVDLVAATRDARGYGIGEIDGMIEYGASPRASIYLALAGKAMAFIRKRGYVLPEDLHAIAHDVLRHRIILTYEAEAEEVTTDHIVERVLKRVPVP
ncbi:MAG: AAA family ATPase [Armatimonadetes bacterium]|nr:AAA family ATPase [Armatimonadota bacterium]MDW8122869.1 AAA family ATPase [Armatimonadota bacterium]